MSNPTPLFNSLSPRGDEFLLLDDLSTLVSLGLVSERSTPEGPVYELTDLGRSTPEFTS